MSRGGNTVLVRRYVRKNPQLAAQVPGLQQHLQAAERAQNINAILADQLREKHLEPVEEHRFHPRRKWAFDLAFPDLLIAIEVEGMDHRKTQRYTSDLTKYNTASERGWVLLRYRAKDVHSGFAAREITRIIRTRRPA